MDFVALESTGKITSIANTERKENWNPMLKSWFGLMSSMNESGCKKDIYAICFFL